MDTKPKEGEGVLVDGLNEALKATIERILELGGSERDVLASILRFAPYSTKLLQEVREFLEQRKRELTD